MTRRRKPITTTLDPVIRECFDAYCLEHGITNSAGIERGIAALLEPGLPPDLPERLEALATAIFQRPGILHTPIQADASILSMAARILRNPAVYSQK